MENSKELLLVADAVSKEKGIDKELVLEALADGIATSLRRNFHEGVNIKVLIDSKTGDISAYRLFELVEQIENVENQMLTNEVEDEIVIDGVVWEPFKFELNRQQFNITKQVALNKIRNESRDAQIQNLIDQEVVLQSGTVKVVKRDQVIVDCNGLDITIFRRSLLPRDNYKNGDKIFFVLEKEKNQYFGTRVSNEYLIEVFKREIYQVEEGDIEIVAVARIPGFRSKVILKSNVQNLNPIKVCIGARGIHIKNINNFLNGEIVDLISYDEDSAQTLLNAIAPVNVVKIVIDEESHSMEFAVPDEEISQAIGRNGKNIELVSKLLGWNLKVLSETEWNKKDNKEHVKYISSFMFGLECDEEIATTLVENGFTSFEEIAYVPNEEFEDTGLDNELITALKENADILMKNKLMLKTAIGFGELNYLGFSEDEIKLLSNENVLCNQDVADLSTFDLTDILTTIDSERAKCIIISARKEGENNGELN
jgi:N utilization substance protein A